MVGLLKVEGLSDNTTAGDIRRYFKENGAQPEDVHVKKDQREAIAFLIFTERRETEMGLQADGSIFRDRRLLVRESNPQEFNRFFPGIAMLTGQQRDNKHGAFNNQENLVIKVEGLDIRTSISEIRKHFKEKGARPVDIHITPGNGRNYNVFGNAFLIFNNRRDAENALRADGTILRNHNVTVRISNPFEFNQMFPGTPMITVKANLENDKKSSQFVIKVDGLDLSAKPGDIRQYFRENGARPDDIHLIKGPNGQHDGSALLVFADNREMEIALQADGTFFRSRKLSVRRSNPKEFNRFFPGADMLSSKGEHSLPKEFGRPRNESGNTNRNNITQRGNRDRSRSPIRVNKNNHGQQQFFDNLNEPSTGDNSDPLGDIDKEKFLRMSGLPYDASATQIVNYFEPIPIREIFILKHTSGKFRGQTNGSAVVEFFAKNTASRAVEEWDGKFISQRLINVRYASKEDICRALQIPLNVEPPPPSFLDAPPVNDVPNGNAAQMQSLLNLLTATVTAMAGQQQQQPPHLGSSDPQMRPRGGDSVVNRVATSANINVSDIRRGCVVGMRNLPFSVTPDQIMQFFEGFYAIANSIRIHFLDSGRCSGDAIVSFRGNRDATNAVSALNRKTIGHRKVELFFL